MRKAILLLLSIAFASCTNTSAISPPNLVQQTSDCRTPDGWDAVVERDPDFIVFGELHGTREAPAFVGSLACGLALNGERLLVGIEFSPDHEDALQKAWNAKETDFERLLLDAGWRGRDDGVGSRAMFAMVRDLYRLKQSGYPIAITAFNGAGSDEQRARFAHLPGQGPHEAAQAENIATAAQGAAYDRVLILVGGLHAKREAVDLGFGAFDPMAKRLRSYGSVISLDARYGAGTSWSCHLRSDFDMKGGRPTKDDLKCAAHPASATGLFERDPFIALADGTDDSASNSFDGYFWLGRISASPPQAPKDDRTIR